MVGLGMHTRQPKIPMTEQMQGALADLGAEPLAGSGFEDETPDQEFSDSEPAAALPPR